ncbi:MAG: sugar-binding transcriptional regulator [Firmicutes bacterium]|nr:sugar-binding transcriptional regulator [Bacillota bacterium]
MSTILSRTGSRGGSTAHPDLSLLTKVARLYYEEDLSQREIAARLQMSRPTVCRLIKRAKESGLVRISIVSPVRQCSALEIGLEKRFGLRQAVVVTAQGVEPKQAIAGAAADLLVRIIKPDDVVAVSWGSTLRAVVDALKPVKVKGVTAVPLIGGAGNTSMEVHSNSIAVDLARKLGGSWRVLYAPAVVGSAELRDAIVDDPNIKEVLDTARAADIAMVGVGVPVETSTMVKTGYLKPEQIRELRDHGAVGHISWFYDIDGKICDAEVNRRIVGLPLREFKGIKRVIAVAAGPGKVESIRGALRGGFCDTLVTDDRTAESILKGS